MTRLHASCSCHAYPRGSSLLTAESLPCCRQVFDISEHRPDKVLSKLYENIKAAEAAGDIQVRHAQAVHKQCSNAGNRNCSYWPCARGGMAPWRIALGVQPN